MAVLINAPQKSTFGGSRQQERTVYPPPPDSYPARGQNHSGMDARCGTRIPVVRRVWRQTGRRGAPPEENRKIVFLRRRGAPPGKKITNIVFLWRREAPPEK